MSEDRPIYVIDTNILIDYVDVIPGEGAKQPHEPTIDLSEAHIVIPTVVVRELSKFKGEKSERGKASRTVLRRLRNLFEDDIHSMAEVYNLKAPIEIYKKKQQISIMPLHKNFSKCLAFHPSDTDMDGQIILTALAVSMAQQKKRVDGTELIGSVSEISFDNVVLLTNDNGLAIRARERALSTSRYGYKYPAPYTGRREVQVPAELFADFYNDPDNSGISRARFEELMPDEPPLVANEFIVMGVADPSDLPIGFDPFNNPYFEHVGRYDPEQEAIVKLRYVDDCLLPQPRNVGQAIYKESLLDQNIAAVICTGPAGSGKTFMATIFGYNACKAGWFIGVTAVPCENRSNIGALPGDLDEKMDPDVQPLKNALRNYLLREDSDLKKALENHRNFGPDKAPAKKRKGKKGAPQGDVNDALNEEMSGTGNDSSNGNGNGKRSLKLRLKDKVNNIWDNWFSVVPIESARGRDFAYELAIYDEFQDQNAAQADTLIKRLGMDGKIILTGDVDQIHAPYLDRDNNGLNYASRLLLNNKHVAQVCFTEDEVVRHPLVQEVAKRQKAEKTQPH
ncbi:PhoH family protein [Candidatus Saccharibacteria bacterium]|nr:PhoH family protein [Candidatus Saccharibacteria bacterium]